MSLTGSGLRDAGGWQRVGKKALLVEEQDALRWQRIHTAMREACMWRAVTWLVHREQWR